MAPFSTHGQSYESLQKGNTMSLKNDDTGSIGSDTFRSQRRRAYEECETDEQLFSQHNTQTIYDNRHHDIDDYDDLNSAGSSLGGYSDLGDNASKGGSVRTREELRLSLIARRRRLAHMENAMAGDGSIDFSLKLNRPNEDNRSLVSSLRDSIISFNDSLQGSLLSRKEKKKAKDKKSKDKKKKSKKKSSSKDKDRDKRKDKDKKDKKKKSSKHKSKEKEKHHKSKKSDKKKHNEEDDRKAKKSKSKQQQISSDESSSESDSDGEEEYSKYSKRPQQHNPTSERYYGADRDGRIQQQRRHSTAQPDLRGDKGRAKAIISKGGKSMKNMLSKHDMEKPSTSAGVVQYACNEHTGMCAFHSDVQLRKKSRFGGWKDVLRQCPKCAAEQHAKNSKAPPVTRRNSAALDRSNRSASTSRGAPARHGNGSMDYPNQGPPVTGRRGKGSGGLDRTRSASRGGAQREGDRTRQPGRGMPRAASMRVGSSQRQLSDNRPRQHAYSDSSSSSSSSSSSTSSKKGGAQLQQQQQHAANRRMTGPQQGRRTADPRGTSQPPVTRMPRPNQRSGSQRRSNSQQPTRESMRQRQNQSRRREMSVDPPGSDSESITRRPAREKIVSSKHPQPPNTKRLQRPQAEETRAGRERIKPQEQASRQSRSASAQRIAAVVDFDPPNPHAEPVQQRPDMNWGKQGGYQPSFGGGIDSESDSDNNEEEKKMNYSESQDYMMNQSSIDVGREARINSYDNNHDEGRIRKGRSQTFHGMPPSTSKGAATSTQQQPRHRRSSLTSQLEGISAEALMNFVMTQSAHFDGVDNPDDLERALMEQVARLSIGSGEGDVSDEDSKFSVLREVVKSYMNEEKKKTNNNNSGQNGMHSSYSPTKNDYKKAESSPKEEPSQNYNLGDEGRRRDMIKDDDKDVALMRIASLQPNDPAFIRRTTGKWTFAKVKKVDSDSIVFIVNPNGSSKGYNVKYWVSHIRTLKSPARGNNHGPDGHQDVSGRRGAFMKQSDQTRFSIKNLRPDGNDDSWRE